MEKTRTESKAELASGQTLYGNRLANLIDSAVWTKQTGQQESFIGIADTVVYPGYGQAQFIEISGGRIMRIYGRGNDDEAEPVGQTVCDFSDDGGLTWGDLVVIHTGTTSAFALSSVYKSGTTIKILGPEYTGTAVVVRQTESTDEGLTWSALATKHTPASYISPAHDRVIRLSDGVTLLWPYGLNTNGDPQSSTGNYTGKILKSVNEGVTWTLMGVTITGPDNLCVEPGIIEANGILYFYMRTRSGSVYVCTSDLTAAVWTTPVSMGLMTPNSMTTIKYDARNNLFIAAHNSLFKIPPVGTTDPNDRAFMYVSVYNPELNFWEQCCLLDYGIYQGEGRYLIEASIFIYRDKVFFAWTSNKRDEVEAVRISDLKMKILPVEFLLPRFVQNLLPQLKVRATEIWPQDGAFGGTAPQAFGLDLGILEIGDRGYYRVWNNPVLGHGGYAPYTMIKIFGTTRGTVKTIDGDSIDDAEPYEQTTYYNDGVTPATTKILKRLSRGATNVQAVNGDGTIEFFDTVTGIIWKAPNGNRYKVTINNTPAFVFTLL